MKAIASSKEFTAITGRTGPNTSFCMMGSVSVTSVRMVGASHRGGKSFSTASHLSRDAAAAPPPALTDVFLCFYHLSTHSHLARPPQQVFSTVKELQIDHAAVAAGLCWIGTVELHHAALQSLHEACFDLGVAQDVVGSHQTLSGVVETGPSDALSRSGDFAVFINITGVL